VLITAALLIYSVLFRSALSPLTTFVVLLLVIAVLAAALAYFSVCCRQLVDFDVDSFIYDRSYNGEVAFNPAVVAAIPEPASARLRGPWYLNAAAVSEDML
jgi:hypothetical protein